MTATRKRRPPCMMPLPSGSGTSPSPAWNIWEQRSKSRMMDRCCIISRSTCQSSTLSRLKRTEPRIQVSPSLNGVTERERTKLRALIGGLQWAATQTAPHLQPHTSFIAGQTSRATISTLQAANKALIFAKANADVGLQYRYIGPLEDLVVVGYSDASFACRDDLSSQGGYLITLCHRDVAHKGEAGPYHVLDWRSFKLNRVSRSTLSAEGQAASEAADAIYYTSLFLKGCLDPDLDMASATAAHLSHQSCLVVDAKALYDLLIQDEMQARVGAEKRTAVEILVTKQRLLESSSFVRWVSSERQLADGLTKESATQLLADRLRTHRNRLVDDTSYQAARRKDVHQRHASAMEFALSRPQALSAMIASSCIMPVDATAATTVFHPLDFWDCVWLILTLLIMVALAKLLWMPWNWAIPVQQRAITHEQSCQTDLQLPAESCVSTDSRIHSSISQVSIQIQTESGFQFDQHTQASVSTADQWTSPDPSPVLPTLDQWTLTDPPPVLPTSDQWTLTDPSPVSVEYRRVELPSNSSQVSGITAGAVTLQSVGLQARPSTRNVALQFGTDVPPSATVTFPGPNPGGPPSARGIPFEHRFPMDFELSFLPMAIRGTPHINVLTSAHVVSCEPFGHVACALRDTRSLSYCTTQALEQTAKVAELYHFSV